jgi:hypothetical protein
MKKYFLSLVSLFFFLASFAQGEVTGNGNDMMRGHLKIYVVVAVLGIILAGLFVFLFAIERRLAKLEEK